MLARMPSWPSLKNERYNTIFSTNYNTDVLTSGITYWYSQTSTAYFTGPLITSHLTLTEFNRLTNWWTLRPTAYNTTRETWKVTTWW